MSTSVHAATAAQRETSVRRDGRASTLAWRLWPGQWRDERAFSELCRLLRAYPAAVSEIACFLGECECHHGMRDFAVVREDVALLRERIATLRADGIPTVGINLLPSFGRGGVPGDEPMTCQPLVDSRGRRNTRNGCPMDPDCAALAHERARLAATCGPDFIWVDDHCRLRDGCFCPRCVAAFDGGGWSSREELVAALDDPDRAPLRARWIAYNEERLRRFCADERAAVDAVDPSIEMGFMMVGGDGDAICGDYVRQCCAALRANRARPGHGWYREEQGLGRGLLRKVVEDARTVGTRLPASVIDIQHEYETWPGGSLDKSVRGSVLEITCAIAAGCTGVAMNARHAMGRPSEVDERLHAALADHRGRWDALVEAARGLPLRGMWLPQPLERLARVRVGDGGLRGADRLVEREAGLANDWYLHGVPPAVRQEDACGTFLGSSTVQSLDDAALRAALGGFAILDGDAVRECHHRGLGDLVGVAAGAYRSSTHQRLLAHPFNGDDAGAEHVDPAPWIWPLHALAPGAEALGEVLDLHHEPIGASAVIFENALGGRVASLGYCPWHRLDLPSRWRHLMAILDWGSRGQMPLRFERLVRVTPWWRCSGDGSRAVLVLANLGLDDTGPLRVRARCGCAGIHRLAADGSLQPVATRREGEELVIDLADVPAWSAEVLIGE